MIERFSANAFRLFDQVEVRPCPGLNVFHGPNGCGKTSIIEAIYFLFYGRSFRTHVIDRVIKHGHESFYLNARLLGLGTQHSLGMQKNKSAPGVLKLDHDILSRQKDIVTRFPVQLLSPDRADLFVGGTKPRRYLMDWGVFYHYQDFPHVWQRYAQALRQRNALLKNNSPYDQVQAWDQFLHEGARQIDQMRNEYITQLKPKLDELMTKFGLNSDITISYQRGWPGEGALIELLARQFDQDKHLGFTSLGPHRADLKIKVGKRPAGDVLSRGQQKVFFYTLKLAQGKLLGQTQKSCLYLLDDMSSELDEQHQQQLFGVLSDLNSQIIMTSIKPYTQDLPFDDLHQQKI